MNPEVVYIILGGLVALELAIHVFSIVVIVPIFERKLPFEVPTSESLNNVERLSIPTSDGLTLRGSLQMPHDAPLGVVVFCPEFQGTHWAALDYCQGLLDFGFASWRSISAGREKATPCRVMPPCTGAPSSKCVTCSQSCSSFDPIRP